MLDNASVQTTELFIKTLPFNLIDNVHNLDSDGSDILIDNYFSKPVNGNSLSTDFANGNLSTIKSYLADGADLGDQVMLMFKAADLVSFADDDDALQAAKNQTFGDLTRTDLENMIQDIGQYSPHELVWSLIRDDNHDNVFDDNDHFYSLVTTQLGMISLDL